MTKKFPSLKSKAVLSPMAGVTDVAFRALAKKYGAGLTYTEFVSSHALIQGSKKTFEMIQTSPDERPVAVQLFGNSEKDVVSAAKIVEEKFDIIDVNCGCPAWKVIQTGAGSALLNNPEKISHFISKLSSAISKPVTVKIRSGIDDKRINAVEIAKLVENSGASAIAIHGRTQKQGYSGNADWNIIRQVKSAVNIPVIGNGDVFSPETFKSRLEESGVDAIMIARGAIGNPYLFTQINDFLEKGSYEKISGIKQFAEYISLAEKYSIPFSSIKHHAMSFTKGIHGSAKLRNGISRAKDLNKICEILKTFILLNFCVFI